MIGEGSVQAESITHCAARGEGSGERTLFCLRDAKALYAVLKDSVTVVLGPAWRYCQREKMTDHRPKGRIESMAEWVAGGVSRWRSVSLFHAS